MKTSTRWTWLGIAVVCVLLGLIVATMPGCAMFKGSGSDASITTSQRYSIAVSTYDACVRAMVTASRINAIEADDYLKWNDELRRPASAALNAWAAAIAQRRPTPDLNALNALLDAMVAARVNVERKVDTDASKHSAGPPTHRSRDRACAGRDLRDQHRKLRWRGPDRRADGRAGEQEAGGGRSGRDRGVAAAEEVRDRVSARI